MRPSFISTAEQDNDENLVIVDDPVLARVSRGVRARVCAGAIADALSLNHSPPRWKAPFRLKLRERIRDTRDLRCQTLASLHALCPNLS
jgi:hypothetical protein